MEEKGFTLSEVLIALVIIGVLAAILIPATMNNTNSHEYRSGYKKAISVLNQALARHFALERMTAQDYDSAEILVQEVFKKRLSIIEHNPEDISVAGCNTDSKDVYFVTTDGMIFCVNNFLSDMSSEPYSKCDFQNVTPCIESEGPNIWIDVNGDKKPNKLTQDISNIRDVFPAVIYSQKVLPYGDVAESVLYNGDVAENDEQHPVPETPDNPSAPETPSNPNTPDIPDINWDAEEPDVDNPYYDDYNPNDWPSWLDFLKWLLDWLKNLFG